MHRRKRSWLPDEWTARRLVRFGLAPILASTLLGLPTPTQAASVSVTVSQLSPTTQITGLPVSATLTFPSSAWMVTSVSAPHATVTWTFANLSAPTNPERISWTARQPGVVRAIADVITDSGQSATVHLPPVRFVGPPPVTSGTNHPVTPTVINRAWDATDLLPRSGHAPTLAVAVSDEAWTAQEAQAIRQWSLQQGIPPVAVHRFPGVASASSLTTQGLLTSETATDILALTVSAPGATAWLLPWATLMHEPPTSVAQLLVRHQVRVLSISYAEDLGATAALSQAWVTRWAATVHALNAVGITVVASAGDTGPYVGTSGSATQGGVDPIGVSLLTSPANVTVVGGADWRSTSTGRTFAMAYWGANTFAFLNPTIVATWTGLPDGLGNLLGGGGYSPWTPMPPWQQPRSGPTTWGRGTPDVVGPASGNYPGWHPTIDHTPLSLGGTSFAAPLSAGWIADCSARVGHGLGNINPALYALARTDPAAFVPATVGNNGIYQVIPGARWNPLVGLGAPRWATICSGLAEPHDALSLHRATAAKAK